MLDFKYAQIVGGVVVGVQESQNKIISEKLTLVDGDLPEVGSTYLDGVFTVPVVLVEVIRKISTGAMQRRFTPYEEIAIKADPLTDVIRSRLFNANHCDLDFQDTKDGMAVIVNMLTSAPDPFNSGQVLVADFNIRYDKLLQDGTVDEVL